jgi:hypothetical protein
MFKTTLTALALAAALAVGAGPANAQQRSPNVGAKGLLHVWPDSGVWAVALNRFVQGGLGCVMVTAYHNQSTGERYIWGIRQYEQQIGAVISDSELRAVAGPEIKVIVDDSIIGSYPVTRRLEPGNGFHSVVSELSAHDGRTLVDLMQVGGELRFVTDVATYSASLAGAEQAMRNFEACSREAATINSTAQRH